LLSKIDIVGAGFSRPSGEKDILNLDNVFVGSLVVIVDK